MELMNRDLEINTRNIDDKKRQVPVVLSTQNAVNRGDFLEVLMHEKPENVDLSRAPLPLIESHDRSQLNIGIVDNLRVEDLKLRGTLKLGRSKRATDIWEDIKAGIIRSVSIGYRWLDWEEDGNVIFVHEFEIQELSLVSTPADIGAGINRSIEMNESRSEVRRQNRSANSERERVEDILALGDQHNHQEAAREFISEGRTLENFRNHVLNHMQEANPLQTDTGDSLIGLTNREIRNFSFTRAILAQAKNDWRDAGFERECSRAVEKKLGKSARGIFVPYDVQTRDLTAGTASQGGDLVATDLLSGSFIDVLRNKSYVMEAGATVLRDLQGDVAIPKKSTTSTAYWVSEGTAPTESEPAFSQVTMSPNTIGTFTDFSRRLLIQSSIDIENMVRGDLAGTIATALDYASIYGSGVSSEPMGIANISGISTTVLTTPTFSEIVDMETQISTANANSGRLAYMTSNTTKATLKTTEKSTGSGLFLWETSGPSNINGINTDRMNGYPAFATEQITTGDVFFVDWSSLMIGLWSGLDILVDNFTNSTTGGVRVVALMDADVSIKYPESVCYSS